MQSPSCTQADVPIFLHYSCIHHHHHNFIYSVLVFDNGLC